MSHTGQAEVMSGVSARPPFPAITIVDLYAYDAVACDIVAANSFAGRIDVIPLLPGSVRRRQGVVVTRL